MSQVDRLAARPSGFLSKKHHLVLCPPSISYPMSSVSPDRSFSCLSLAYIRGYAEIFESK